jgi:hypothetical protein
VSSTDCLAPPVFSTSLDNCKRKTLWFSDAKTINKQRYICTYKLKLSRAKKTIYPSKGLLKMLKSIKHFIWIYTTSRSRVWLLNKINKLHLIVLSV